MRVVFDTNVLVSALLWPGRIPDQAVAAARQGQVQAITSPALLEELRRILRRKLGFQEDRVEMAIEAVVEHSELVNPSCSLQVVRADPADDRVLECALEGRADAVVTGDHHLLELKEYKGIAVLNPKDFLERIS